MEPETSAFSRIGSSLTSPAAMSRARLSSVRRAVAFCFSSRSFSFLKEAICRALASFATAWKRSPALGLPAKPMTSTGVAGPAELVLWPWSSTMARTLPNDDPAMKGSPGLSVPVCTSTVATMPRARSNLASRTKPVAGFSGSALNSLMSATSRIISSSSFSPVRFLAETSQETTSPPYSSTSSSCSASCCLTRPTFASGLSILLMATTIGTSAARA